MYRKRARGSPQGLKVFASVAVAAAVELHSRHWAQQYMTAAEVEAGKQVSDKR